MARDILSHIAALGRQVGHVLVATAGNDGLPHLAVAGEISAQGDDHLIVGEWFCPGMLANLQQNGRVAVVVWDPSTDTGHQALGRVQRIEDVAVLDGYAPRVESRHPTPQIERRLTIHVETILQFSRRPHTDQVEFAVSSP